MFQYGLCEMCQSNNCNVHSWEGQEDFTALSQDSSTTHTLLCNLYLELHKQVFIFIFLTFAVMLGSDAFHYT